MKTPRPLPDNQRYDESRYVINLGSTLDNVFVPLRSPSVTLLGRPGYLLATPKVLSRIGGGGGNEGSAG